MKIPTLSILTTVYNRANYLAECIESILNSSFQDWELIIVDDCSKDNSFQIMEEYAKKDIRITAYKNENNLGDYPNRNKAASYATGKYIKYLDADDTLYRFSLEIMVQAMEKFPEANIGLSHNIFYPNQPFPFLSSSKEALYNFFMGTSALGVGPTEAIIKNEAFKNVGGFSGKQYIGDMELWLKLAKGSPVVSLPPALAYWRQHEDQQIVSERKNVDILKIRHLHKLKVLDEISDILTEEEKRKALKYTKFRYARMLWNYVLFQQKIRTALKLYKNSKLTLLEVLKAPIAFKYSKKRKTTFV